MFLRRLETVGFKSFAERTTIEFVPGVTAVVGPNGSGKSNIIDAVRWVLGEQSARSLRGQKMEDIIFQGSDTRKQLNYAEVSLVLNNEQAILPIDYQEVNVTRRVYRSGESEFYLNKQACRLKDIVDLFMDTGLGRESFSIIGQGKIEEILSSKAEERRAIFEEAAGVLKYKQRKIKAEYKLQETADNLDRVEDIIHEIKQQIEPLERQAEVAKKYKQLKQDLQDVEIALYVTEIESLHEKWQTILANIEQDKLKEIEDKTVIQEKEAMVVRAREELVELENKLSRLQQALLKETEKVEQLEGQRNVLSERTKHKEANKTKLLSQQEMAYSQLEEIKKLLEAERTKLNEATNLIEKIQKNIHQINKSLSRNSNEIQAEIESLKADYIEFLNEQAVLENKLQAHKAQLTRLDQRRAEEVNDSTDYVQAEAKLKNKLSKETAVLTSAMKLVAKQEEDMHNWRKALEESRVRYEKMQTNLYEGNEHIAKLTSRKEMLEEMKENMQGYFLGVKAVLQASKQNKLKDIAGVVIDLIDVPEKYITAIDTILGAQAQHIVVKDDQAAREAIGWLKQVNKGRATFLPIASIANRMIPSNLQERLKENSGFIGIAADLVQIAPAYKQVTAHLLGNIIVVDHIDTATNIARITNRRYRIVTLDGDLVSPGGAISGGARRQANQSLFTREKEITILAKQIKQLSIKRDSFLNEIEQKRAEIAGHELALEKTTDALNKENKKIEALQETTQQLRIKLHQASDQITIYDVMLKQMDEEEAEEKAVIIETETKLAQVQKQIKQIEITIETLTREAETLADDRKQLESQLSQAQIENAKEAERKLHLEQMVNSYEQQLASQTTEIKQIEKELAAIEDLEIEAKSDLELAEMIAEVKINRKQLEADINEKVTIRKEKQQFILDEEQEIKGLTNVYTSFLHALQEKEVQANRLDVALENRLQSLQTKYTTTYEKAAASYKQDIDVEQAKEEVANSKRAIDQLGIVNLGAIDEFDRLSERNNFLQTQQKDLQEAKSTLYAVIEEMDKEMTTKFKTMFDDIQSAFTTVFKRLFGGGDATLILTEPEELLTTGIDIFARPPGKKLKNLSLLSGGERALTAIALLFAILQVRPVPFCILDEVDAALDEANVTRFGQYLQAYRDDTQFIVITHRKGTMEEADALYGVTMQESGVSRLVSVRLEDKSTLVEA